MPLELVAFGIRHLVQQVALGGQRVHRLKMIHIATLPRLS